MATNIAHASWLALVFVLASWNLVLAGDLPQLRTFSQFEVDDCAAFEGSSKQASVRAFCDTITARAGFPMSTICDVVESGCPVTRRRRSLLQTETLTIVQQGDFDGNDKTTVQGQLALAILDAVQVRDEAADRLADAGDEGIADAVRGTSFQSVGRALPPDEDPDPVPNECSTDPDCGHGYFSPVCLTSATPRICVECIDNTNCDQLQRCTSFNLCVALP